jgi:hypothetical protein
MQRVGEAEFFARAEAARNQSGNASEIVSEGFSYFLRPELGFAGRSGGLLDPEVHAAIEAFFSRDWWTRAWVVQEGTTSVETRICCGNDVAMQGDVEFLVNILLRFACMAEYAHYQAHIVAWRLYTFRSRRKYGGVKMRFEEVLQFFRVHDATDPRDLVYAPLGLALDTKSHLFRIDYNLPCSHVYRDVANYFLDQEQNMDWLGSCGAISVGSRLVSADLPSWITDWSYVPFCETLPIYIIGTDGKTHSIYRASCTLHGQMSHIKVDLKQLTLHGVFVDTIDTLKETAAVPFHDTSAEDSWCPRDRDICYIPTGETEYEAFLRTLVADVEHGAYQVRKRGCSMRLPERSSVTESQIGYSLPNQHQIQSGFSIHSLLLRDPDPLTPLSNMKAATAGRRFARTKEHRYMCLVPQYAEVGDSICVFADCQVPLVVRRRTKETWVLVGESYVHGLMDGEVSELVNKEAKIEEIVLE